MKKVSLIIVNYNGERFLERLFDTIKNQTFKDFEVLFVDNSSKDNSVDFVRKNYPESIIIPSSNRGYGYACNVGAKMAKGKYLAFLNEDMYLPPDFVERMVKFREKISDQEKIGGISCKMVDFDSDPDIFGKNYSSSIDFLGFPVKNKTPRDILVISGCPFFISRDLYNSVGGFNEMIFIYGEDVDLSWRLKILGYDHFMNHDTFLYHFGGGATGSLKPQKIANIVFGSFISIFSNYSALVLIAVLPFFLTAFLFFYLFLAVAKLDVNYITEIIKKFIFFAKNFQKAFSIRSFVQKNRKKNDLFILKYISFVPAFFLNHSMKKFDKDAPKNF